MPRLRGLVLGERNPRELSRAITGHASISEVQSYTKAADRKHMAREAMDKLVKGGW